MSLAEMLMNAIATGRVWRVQFSRKHGKDPGDERRTFDDLNKVIAKRIDSALEVAREQGQRDLLKAEIAEYEDLQRKAVDELVRLRTELARLRTALVSAQSDRQRAVDDLFAQLRENARLRAESMRGAVEALRAESARIIADGGFSQMALIADWLEQQSASQGQPLENIEGLAQAQPVCRASQTAMMRAEMATRTTPAKPEKEKP